jgi:hypothetical protein
MVETLSTCDGCCTYVCVCVCSNLMKLISIFAYPTQKLAVERVFSQRRETAIGGIPDNDEDDVDDVVDENPTHTHTQHTHQRILNIDSILFNEIGVLSAFSGKA